MKMKHIEQVGDDIALSPSHSLRVSIVGLGKDERRGVYVARIVRGKPQPGIVCFPGKQLADLRERLIEAEARALVGGPGMAGKAVRTDSDVKGRAPAK